MFFFNSKYQTMSNAAYKSIQFQTNEKHRGETDTTQELGDE